MANQKVCKSDDFSTGKTAEKAALNCCLLAGEEAGREQKEVMGSGAGGVAFKSTNYLCNGSGTTNEFADGQKGHNALKYAACATVCVCVSSVCVRVWVRVSCVPAAVLVWVPASWSRLNNRSLIGAKRNKRSALCRLMAE